MAEDDRAIWVGGAASVGRKSGAYSANNRSHEHSAEGAPLLRRTGSLPEETTVYSGDGPTISQPWRWHISATSRSFIDAKVRCARCCSSNNPPASAGV